MKLAVDTLKSTESATFIAVVIALLGYGLMWTSSEVFVQVREILAFPIFEISVTLLSKQIVDHLSKLSIRYHLNRKTGALTNAVERAQTGLPKVLWGILFFFIPSTIEVLFAAGILMYFYSYVYALILLGTLGLFVTFLVFGSSWAVRARREAMEHGVSANARIVDGLFNVETVRYFCNQEFESEEVGRKLAEREHFMARSLMRMESVHAGQGFILGMGLTLMTLVAGLGVYRGVHTIGDFVLLVGYALQLMMPLMFLGSIFKDVREGLTSMEHIHELLDEEVEVVDAPNAPGLKADHGSITFEDVKFEYDPRRPILKGVSLTVPAQQTVAIVGATGAGKSTIGNLLFRFFDLTSGRILIDGQDIAKVTQNSLRQVISVVPQQAVLFNDTLYYNLAYGRPSATREEVEEAARLAHLDAFIKGLPDGYDTMVGERGLKLSGGEKQRVAIARAVLKRPKIYLFDEATSALDTSTERQIQANLREVSEGVTTLVIAHRLSTIVDADKIVVLDKGQVIEEGTHEELLAKGTAYHALWMKQQK